MSYLAGALAAIIGLTVAGPLGAFLGVLIWAVVKYVETDKKTKTKS